jgi:hypothetical protein
MQESVVEDRNVPTMTTCSAGEVVLTERVDGV